MRSEEPVAGYFHATQRNSTSQAMNSVPAVGSASLAAGRNRQRRMVAGILSWAFLGVCVVHADPALGQPGRAGQFSPPPIVQLRLGYYMAGLPAAEFEYFAAPRFNGRQRQANWCWAAAVQMVLNYHGLLVTQEQVVARIYGRLIDRPAQPQQVLEALSGWAPDVHGRFSAISASPLVHSGAQIVGDLAWRQPLIVGLAGQPVGHAYVLTAVYFRGSLAQPIIEGVVLRDPWPLSPSRQELTWREFMARLRFIARVRVTRMM